MPPNALPMTAATPSAKASSGYRSDTNGLRSIAVLLVILFHFDLTDALAAGFIGVDIFFVISGYLIVPALRRRIKDKSFRFGEFYVKRIRRLAPPSVAPTMLTLAVALLILTPPLELKAIAKEAIAAQLFAANIYYWRYLDYFGLQAEQSFFLHTWSLGIEEQFHLSFPLILWVAAKVRPDRITSMLVFLLWRRLFSTWQASTGNLKQPSICCRLALGSSQLAH